MHTTANVQGATLKFLWFLFLWDFCTIRKFPAQHRNTTYNHHASIAIFTTNSHIYNNNYCSISHLNISTSPAKTSDVRILTME